mmetsp:Transcript_91001/g.235922  ORF Transcript_91001/g.235922 Transcript_91001/m.235922 type:complete len:252 (+) Transcript_91001:1662-2417(+)
MPATIFVWDASSVGPLLTQVQDGGRAACYDPQRQAAAPRHTVGALGRQRSPADQKLGASREASHDNSLETRIVGLNPIDHAVQDLEGAGVCIVRTSAVHPPPQPCPIQRLGAVTNWFLSPFPAGPIRGRASLVCPCGCHHQRAATLVLLVHDIEHVSKVALGFPGRSMDHNNSLLNSLIAWRVARKYRHKGVVREWNRHSLAAMAVWRAPEQAIPTHLMLLFATCASIVLIQGQDRLLVGVGCILFADRPC